MIPLLLAVLTASLLGSLHCAGMCGGVVALCSRRGAGVIDHLAYHGARGLSYTLVGAVAGGLGGAFELGGQLLGVQRTVSVVAGVSLIALGALALWRAAGWRAPSPFAALSPRLRAGVNRAVAVGADLPPRSYTALLGLLTPLLPCGWLYVFALAAAGTASPFRGAALMATFWLGTVPILFALALGLRAAAARMRRFAPALGGLVLIGVGALLVLDRGQLTYGSLQAPEATPTQVPHAPSPVTVPTRAPCCSPKPEPTRPPVDEDADSNDSTGKGHL